MDTAGLRDSSDDIELQGMQRARAEVASADIIALVQDASAAGPANGLGQSIVTAADSDGSFGDNNLGLPGLLLGSSSSNGAPASGHGQQKKLLLVRNKADLLHSALSERGQDAEGVPACSISCKTGEGMDALLQSLSALVADVAGSGEGQDGSTLITRHAPPVCYHASAVVIVLIMIDLGKAFVGPVLRRNMPRNSGVLQVQPLQRPAENPCLQKPNLRYVACRLRHRQLLEECAAALLRYEGAWQEVDIAAEELRAAARALGKLTGAIGTEEVLDSIFSEFCIGK